MKWYVDIGVLGGAMGKFRPGQGKCLVHVLGWHTLTKAIRRMQFIEFFTIGAVAYLICARDYTSLQWLILSCLMTLIILHILSMNRRSYRR